jgi:hypothetical protein
MKRPAADLYYQATPPACHDPTTGQIILATLNNEHSTFKQDLPGRSMEFQARRQQIYMQVHVM